MFFISSRTGSNQSNWKKFPVNHCIPFGDQIYQMTASNLKQPRGTQSKNTHFLWGPVLAKGLRL